jgi:hypothetical protein
LGDFRFQSGFFFRHPLLDQYDYYWRIEPDVDYYCDIDYDVFKFMRDNNKKYGMLFLKRGIPNKKKTHTLIKVSILRLENSSKPYPHSGKPSSNSNKTIARWVVDGPASASRSTTLSQRTITVIMDVISGPTLRLHRSIYGVPTTISSSSTILINQAGSFMSDGGMHRCIRLRRRWC